MRTKKQIEKMMIGMLLGGGCLLSSCHSVYMSAEDRLQGDYQEAVAEVELETVEELTAFAYSDVSVIPYTVENIARGFTDVMKKLKNIRYVTNMIKSPLLYQKKIRRYNWALEIFIFTFMPSTRKMH